MKPKVIAVVLTLGSVRGRTVVWRFVPVKRLPLLDLVVITQPATVPF